MNKNEKQIAALYISGCLYDMKRAQEAGDAAGYEKAEKDYIQYKRKVKALLEMHFDMFCTDYRKTVENPMHEIFRIAQVFFAQRCAGQQLKYPAA